MKITTLHTLRIYWEHSRRYYFTLSILIVSLLFAVVADVWRPFFYKALFDAVADGPTAYTRALFAIRNIIITGCAAWLFWRIAIFTNNYFQPRVISDLLNTCFHYLHEHSYNFFNNNFVGTLVRRANRFVRSFEDIADIWYWHLGQTALRIGLILFVLYRFHPPLAFIISAWSLVYIGLNYWFAQFKLPYDVRHADADTHVFGYFADTVTNNINLKLFGGLRKEFQKFKSLTQKLFTLKRLSWNLSAMAESVQAGLMIILEAVILLAAIRLWRAGRLTVGDFALIQTYLIQIFERLWDIGRYIKQIYERLADAEGMTVILTTPHEVKDIPHANSLAVSHGAITFRNVTFGYIPQRPIFKHFHLSIHPGERVALIGPSGGGKSTLVKLLFRFHDLSHGSIHIDHADIAAVTQVSLRAAIGLVPQDPILFHRTLHENIAYTKPHASKKEVIRAARLAHCHEFISRFPDQYQTYVGERGIKLSGGERQRVAIARAILKDAPILVLDEATSSLDSESEALIQDALKNLMRGKTTIVIAHRLSTIMQMDRILVLERGKIVEEGTHRELIASRSGTYQRLWNIQAGGFHQFSPRTGRAGQ